MPALAPERMTPAQREVATLIASGRRGEVSGPFVPALRSAEFTRRLQHLGEYLRYDNALPPRIREIVILLTAQRWSQKFEWSVHVPIALEAGLTRATLEDVGAGRRPSRLSDDEGSAFDFVRELIDTRAVSDRTYDAAVAAFGEAAVIDMIGTIGYYSTLAMIMNVARTPAPAADPPLL
jgi:4-carboxymuconolactone decarboxylase